MEARDKRHGGERRRRRAPSTDYRCPSIPVSAPSRPPPPRCGSWPFGAIRSTIIGRYCASSGRSCVTDIPLWCAICWISWSPSARAARRAGRCAHSVRRPPYVQDVVVKIHRFLAGLETSSKRLLATFCPTSPPPQPPSRMDAWPLCITASGGAVGRAILFARYHPTNRRTICTDTIS
jgi:hypothetical protein